MIACVALAEAKVDVSSTSSRTRSRARGPVPQHSISICYHFYKLKIFFYGRKCIRIFLYRLCYIHMPQLVENRTMLRVSQAAQRLRRRTNGENVVRFMLLCVLAGLVVLMYQRHNESDTIAMAAADGRQCGRGCNI
jgi:hypothetical protein